MRFLLAAGELLSSSLDYHSTLKNVCDAAVETVADICILTVGSLVNFEVVGAAHRTGTLSPQLRALPLHLVRDPDKPAHPIARVLDTGRTVFVRLIDDEWIARHASNETHAEFMRRMNFRSMIIVPVRSQIWGMTGALTLVRTGDSRPYDEDIIGFAEDLGRRCGIAIGKARLYSQTVDIAERLQRASLPQELPDVPGITFDTLYEPSDASRLLGGDWYDAFELKDGRLGLTIGDVSGHGIESAARMSSIRNALRMGLVMEPDLSKILRDADFLFTGEVPSDTICTAIVAVLDPATGALTCASAGHPAPLICWDGTVEAPLRRSRAPLGCGNLARDAAESVTVALRPGSMLVFFTDGLLEAHRNYLEGEAALHAALLDPAVRNAESPARAIREACVRGSHPDDLAILVVRYDGGDRPE